MATQAEALLARDAAFETLFDVIQMQPVGAGLIKVGENSYTLKVLLPQRPDIPPPPTVNGVLVEYQVAAGRPELLASEPSPWRAKSLARRAAKTI